MPNEDIDVSNLERLEKYRSFERYRRRAEQEARAPHWWRTYREHFMKETGAGATGSETRYLVLPQFGPCVPRNEEDPLAPQTCSSEFKTNVQVINAWIHLSVKLGLSHILNCSV